MAKINKVELNLGQKIANPFRTTRKSSTNPFYSTNFEGNTIDPLICADVLESFKGKENKLKMITASVMGSMTKLRNSITEPIDGLSTKIHDVSSDIGKGISDSISGIGKNITELGHGISDRWNSLVEKINIKNIGHEKISSELPVAELRALWEKENELIKAKEIALNPEINKEAKVA